MVDRSASKINWQERYAAPEIVTLRVRMHDLPGRLAELLTVIGECGVQTGDISTCSVGAGAKTRAISIFLSNDQSLDEVIAACSELEGVEVVEAIDEVLEIHRNGTIETVSRVPLNTLMDLRMVYTPGVAKVCELIAKDPEEAWNYTGIANRVAVVTDGTAVLGLGDIGPLAGLPVMEGKAAIFSHFVGISAVPVLIDTTDPEEIIDIVHKTASSYGAIQLEDIAAPSCFEVEERLSELLDIPVFHDDQHGTATVCIAGLLNALKRVGRRAEDTTAAVVGAGAAGMAITKLLQFVGIGDVVLCDSVGAIYKGRTERMNRYKHEIAETTNRERTQGSLAEVIKGRDVLIGVARPKTVTKAMVASMAKDPIVFALANPVSEISPKEAREAGAAVAVDGRGMNNALAYPGIFRGALDARAKKITRQMMLAAAQTLAGLGDDTHLLPDMLDKRVHRAVSEAVQQASTASDF